jgi:outer membrane protein assembly factor BamB
VNVRAFDTTSGTLRWTYGPVLGENTGTSPLVANDSTVFAAGFAGFMHAINANTSVARWVTDLREGSTHISAFNPTLSDNEVYVCTKDFDANPSRGTIWALDARTGSVRWKHAFSPEMPNQGSACFGFAAIWHDLVIQPHEDGRVFAFDRSNGQVRWVAPRVHNTEGSLNDMRWASAGGGIVLVTSNAHAGMIVAYDAATGVERWRRTEWGGSLYPPVLDDQVAYVDHGWIFASYDLQTGKTRWQTPRTTEDPEAVFKGQAVIAGDRIFVAGRNGSYALRR